MSNVKNVISRHNRRVLRDARSKQYTNNNSCIKLCNLRYMNECLLDRMCLTKDLLYKAEVKTNDKKDIKTYFV